MLTIPSQSRPRSSISSSGVGHSTRGGVSFWIEVSVGGESWIERDRDTWHIRSAVASVRTGDRSRVPVLMKPGEGHPPRLGIHLPLLPLSELSHGSARRRVGRARSRDDPGRTDHVERGVVSGLRSHALEDDVS